MRWMVVFVVWVLSLLENTLATCSYSNYGPRDIILVSDENCHANDLACLVDYECGIVPSTIIINGSYAGITAIGNLTNYDYYFLDIENSTNVTLKDTILPSSAATLKFSNVSRLDMRGLASWQGGLRLWLGLVPTVLLPEILNWSALNDMHVFCIILLLTWRSDFYLSGFNIQKLPKNLPDTFQELHLTNGSLTDISDLPDQNLQTMYVVNNNIQSITNHDWRSLRDLKLDNNPLETLAYVRLSSQSLKSFSCLNCKLTNITIDSKTADALNALESNRVSLNSNVLTNGFQCEAIGGTIKQILVKQTKYTITACVMPIIVTPNIQYTWIIVGSVFGVIVIGILAFLYLRRKKKLKQLEQEAEPSYFSLDAINIDTNLDKTKSIENFIQFQEASVHDQNECDSTDNQSTKDTSKDQSSQPSNISGNREHDRRIAPLVDSNLVELDIHHLRPYRLELADLYILSTKPLASGAFGEVWLGTYGREQVAIKRLKSHQLNDVQLFINEIVLLAQLNSTYIVKLVGASWSRPIDVECVLEYMDLGDLRNYLVKYSPKEFTWQQKFQSIMSIVQGLVYLHSYHVPIVHRDLKSRNVLLDSIKGTKITDFGTSRAAQLDDTMTNGVGTYQWMAPEVISSTKYSTQADIYSFGIILSEFCTHQVPFANLRHPQTNNLLPQHYFMQKVCAGGFYPSFEGESVPSWVQDVGMQCLQLNADHRPSALELAAILQQFKP